MSTWAKTRKRHLSIIQTVSEEPLEMRIHVTSNSKTGFSIDFPVHATCCPTRVCMGVGESSARCYALGGFMNFPNAIKWHARNQRLVDSLVGAPPAAAKLLADQIYAELPRGHNWLRWNGAGDLSEGACKLINAITRHHPDLALWVITRKPEMARRLVDRPSLRLLFSLDHSTPEKTAQQLRDLAKKIKKGRARLSYTRVSEEDGPPKDVDIVFNKHVGGNFNGWPHKKVCPASLPGTEHAGACDSCRRCFR